MQELRDRLALLLQELRTWAPNEPPAITAKELADRFDLDVITVHKLARSEGFDLVVERTVTHTGMTPGYVNPSEETTAPLETPPEYSDDIPLGTEIGRYEVLERLGEGGMGVVYAAHDHDLNRRVAIKILKLSVSESSDEPSETTRARLLREAQAMAQLSHHPNIVTVYDVGTFAERVFIVMQYIEGRPINEFITVNNLGWEDAIYLYLRAARGLICAHEAGLVHRDFKPDNVLVSDDRGVKVMDFGLTRREGRNPTMTLTKEEADKYRKQPLEANLTETGRIMGTPSYMAPEQFLMLPVDSRSDQFAFCVSLFEALAGFRPYQADSFMSLARAVLDQNIVRPPAGNKVPDWIWDALMKGLRREPNDRWATMHDLSDALREPPPHIKLARRKRWMRRALLLLFPVAGGLGGLAYHEITKPRTAPSSTIEPVFSLSGKIRISPLAAYEEKQVHDTIKTHEGEFLRCYSAVRRHQPDLTGRVDVTFSINSKGKILSAKVVKDTFEDPRVGQCIAASSLFWTFPKPSLVLEADVTYPFIFSPEADPGVDADQ